MKNRDFFFQQYDKINWTNQEKTHLNVAVNQFIIDEIISKKSTPFSIFDIGSGIGFFISMLKDKYGDNWGLSAARAATVVRALEKSGVTADRLHGAFRGEHAPRGSDKAANRRVERYVK